MSETSRFMNTEGSVGEPYAVVHTVTTAEDTAGELTIWTPFSTITGYLWQTLTTAGEKQEQDAYGSSVNKGVLSLEDGSHNLTATNVIHLLIWGQGGR